MSQKFTLVQLNGNLNFLIFIDMKRYFLLILLILPIFSYSQSNLFTFNDSNRSHVQFGNNQTNQFRVTHNQRAKFYSRIQDILQRNKNLNDGRRLVWGKRLPNRRISFKKQMRQRRRAFK